MENAALHGHGVTAIDRFNDWDLRFFGDCMGSERVVSGTHMAKPGRDEFLKRFAELPHDPVIFCSPVESFPEILEKAAKTRRVLNAPASSVEKCRDLEFLRDFCGDDMLIPETSRDGGEPRQGWIIKPTASAGGIGIRADDGLLSGVEYRQKFVDGVPAGGIFFTENGETKFFGLARQINSGFKFAGSVYPADFEPGVLAATARFGERLATAAGLAGWWGADFIIADGVAHLLEVNPRFTAGMELCAKAHGIDLVETQSSAFSGDKCHMETGWNGAYHGRKVVYARGDLVFKNPERWFKAGMRDVPVGGKIISKGEPVISVYASAAGHEECMEKLSVKIEEFEREIYGE
jgi:predicted ATP-grasp superfamily ATP-dependent carboligase